MSIIRSTQHGKIEVTDEAIASLAGGIASESYGVVGMASKQIFKDGIAELLKKNNFSKGIVVTQKENQITIDMYIIVLYGIKISQVVHEVQKKVKYIIEKTLECNVHSVNIHVQGIKEIK